MQTLGLAIGVTQILAFLNTNMLVSPMQNSRIGGPMLQPNVSVFALQWNIGFTLMSAD